jgi:histidinol-phosphate/aromatic aminotransferase/cobyric acid decarboxylase-like protein
VWLEVAVANVTEHLFRSHHTTSLNSTFAPVSSEMFAMTVIRPKNLIRPLVHDLHAYVPGEQPKIKGLIKLNTNENPYPPSPRVLRTVKAAVDGRLRLYPNPSAERLREKLAKLHRCEPENIIVGNGSDEVLALAVRCFVEPVAALVTTRQTSRNSAALSRAQPQNMVQYFTPSYSLYPVLADTHGANTHGVPLNADFSLPSLAELKRGGKWDFNAALTLVTTPNAPSGRGYSTRELETLCKAQRGVIVLDEAYVDAQTSACVGGADILEGILALLSARRIFRRECRTHRRTSQDARQLQRQRPRPDRCRSHAG